MTAGWTLLHGTSLAGVFDAMYPFRIQAGRRHGLPGHHRHATARLWTLLGSLGGERRWRGHARRQPGPWPSRRLGSAVVWALVATVAFDVVSIGFGGNYWHHYLIQLVVPIAVLSGMLVARHRQPAMRTVLVTSLVVAAFSWSGTLSTRRARAPRRPTARRSARVARTGDTIVTALGHADVTQASGLQSPYPYLWSLPALTLDPHLTTLDSVLTGPDAPDLVRGLSDFQRLGHGGHRRPAGCSSARYHRCRRPERPDGLPARRRHACGPEVPGTDSADVAARSTTTFPTQENAMKTVVVVPTYNEAEGILALLDAVLREAPDVDVLVVDDSSPDGTAASSPATPPSTTASTC